MSVKGFTSQYFLYDVRGKITPLNFGPGEVRNLSINDHDIIAGTIAGPPHWIERSDTTPPREC